VQLLFMVLEAIMWLISFATLPMLKVACVLIFPTLIYYFLNTVSVKVERFRVAVVSALSIMLRCLYITIQTNATSFIHVCKLVLIFSVVKYQFTHWIKLCMCAMHFTLTSLGLARGAMSTRVTLIRVMLRNPIALLDAIEDFVDNVGHKIDSVYNATCVRVGLMKELIFKSLREHFGGNDGETNTPMAGTTKQSITLYDQVRCKSGVIIRIHIHIHIRMNTFIHMHIRIRIYIYIHVCIHIPTHIHIRIHTHTHTHMRTHIHTHTYIYIYTYMYTYI
jgi:hypothetical protein